GEAPVEARPSARVEVPDRAAEECDEARTAGRDPVEVALEVADDGVYVDAWVLAFDRVGGVAQGRLAHVERDEAPKGSVRRERVQQQPRLLRRARAQLDERVGGRARRDVACVAGEDRALGTGRVVLRESRDLVEEAATLLVVEPLRGEDLRARGEACAGVGPQRGGEVVGTE